MPTEELERELRSVFARAAAEYQDPEQARRRVLQHNYRPGRRPGLAAGSTAAASTAAVLLGLALSGTFGPAPARGTGTIRTAAFTLTSNPNGTDTLTINQMVLLDPRTLQNDLARYGIPAKVTVGRFCSSNPAPAGFFKVVAAAPPPPFRGDRTGLPKLTINPAAMPAGTELSVGAFHVAHGQRAVLALIDTNSYTCARTMPTTLPAGGMDVATGS